MFVGKEGQPIQNGVNSLERIQVRNGRNRVIGEAVVFRDPDLMCQSAWRELIRTHVFSDDPAAIAMISHENEITQLGFMDLWNIRLQSLRQRRNTLNELAFQALDSAAVVIARES